jgi:hypothetical protein
MESASVASVVSTVAEPDVDDLRADTQLPQPARAAMPPISAAGIILFMVFLRFEFALVPSPSRRRRVV